MRTKQSDELENQESTWIYLLHHQAPPQTRLTAETSLTLPSLNVTSKAINDSAIFGEQHPKTAFTLPTCRLLLPSLSFSTSNMMVSSHNKTWKPSNHLPLVSLPRLNDLRVTTSDASRYPKRACFPKKCDFPMCKNSSRSRGFCYSHGGGRRCRVDDCNNGAVSRDLCKRHGGGRRCRITGCKSSSESGGLCYSHGGGRRCSLSWCSARAKKGGFCIFHLTGDRTPPSVDTTASTSMLDNNVHPNVVETLLLLANDRSNDKMEPITSSPVSLNTSSKSAYAIATLLN
ncbi:unnamed protein product [Peronospora farinosa]|uniref:WRKY19-like zinc finger domain-containing protein n=1 Tax=Peronospora farinosa TaxID=134698 RepID=A0AAV0V085_9STRA|nr:unnamed protein product [Peronospora farinosa]